MLGFLSRCLFDVPIDAAIKSIVQEYHWAPSTIDEMYLDDADHHGIYYWYYHLEKVIEEMKNKK
ncbi:hypothetical protein [Christiangramia sp.]|uniref:hypothetical protein n=1 Tax=Christiangramia sp. TaxID=1931228 RepID=UPI002620BDC4|nr:hypothetical protein [Christiangramia sp.]